MTNAINPSKLAHYFSITEQALDKAKKAINPKENKKALDFLDMAQPYFYYPHYFEKKGDIVTAFAALNYAHGWLDAGARITLFEVRDSQLFTVDN